MGVGGKLWGLLRLDDRSGLPGPVINRRGRPVEEGLCLCIDRF